MRLGRASSGVSRCSPLACHQRALKTLVTTTGTNICVYKDTWFHRKTAKKLNHVMSYPLNKARKKNNLKRLRVGSSCSLFHSCFHQNHNNYIQTMNAVVCRVKLHISTLTSDAQPRRFPSLCPRICAEASKQRSDDTVCSCQTSLSGETLRWCRDKGRDTGGSVWKFTNRFWVKRQTFQARMNAFM